MDAATHVTLQPPGIAEYFQAGQSEALNIQNKTVLQPTKFNSEKFS